MLVCFSSNCIEIEVNRKKMLLVGCLEKRKKVTLRCMGSIWLFGIEILSELSRARLSPIVLGHTQRN